MARWRALLLAGLLVLSGAGGAPPIERVASYSIRARLHPAARRIDGRLDLVWRNASPDPVATLPFHLPLNSHLGETRIDSVRREDGEELEVAAAGALAWVKLAAPVAPGETVSLWIEFASRLPRLANGVGWFGADAEYVQASLWHPLVAAIGWDLRRPSPSDDRTEPPPFDLADFDVALTLPAGCLTAASGTRTAKPRDNGDGTVTVAWTARRVRSFAWVASTRLHRFDRGPMRVLHQADHLEQARSLPLEEGVSTFVDLPAGAHESAGLRCGTLRVGRLDRAPAIGVREFVESMPPLHRGRGFWRDLLRFEERLRMSVGLTR